MAIPLDPKLYQRAKKIADETYETHGAFKSGFIVKTYKKLGGRYADPPSTKEKKLRRWFSEEWKDVGGRAYPVFRPTKRVTDDTPLTKAEIDASDFRRKVRTKQKILNGRLSPFKKRKS
jgi:Family of unknown function (DUF5872)